MPVGGFFFVYMRNRLMNCFLFFCEKAGGGRRVPEYLGRLRAHTYSFFVSFSKRRARLGCHFYFFDGPNRMGYFFILLCCVVQMIQKPFFCFAGCDFFLRRRERGREGGYGVSLNTTHTQMQKKISSHTLTTT